MAHKTFMQTDGYGNCIYLTINTEGEVYDHTRKESADIFLTLRGENRKRRIGHLTYDDGILHVTRKRGKHLHRVTNSYGFNHSVLNESTMFDIKKIHLVEDDGGEFLFPKYCVTQYGTFLNFKGKGFELQRFLNRNVMLVYQIKKSSYEQKDNVETN
jgi:hypothetical protein